MRKRARNFTKLLPAATAGGGREAEGRAHHPFTVQMTEPGMMMVNTPRITGIDGASVTKGMIQGRRGIVQLLEVMRKHFPGCRNARLRDRGAIVDYDPAWNDDS